MWVSVWCVAGQSLKACLVVESSYCNLSTYQVLLFVMNIPLKILKHKQFILGDGNTPFEILPVL